MNYLVITDNTITNIVVAVETVAAEMGLQPWYEGARIGDTYAPPPEPEPQATDTEVLNALLGVSE